MTVKDPDIDKLLADLNITDKEAIENENGSYTIDLDDSNEYIRYYSKIVNSGLFDKEDEASQNVLETSSNQFINDDFTVTLLASWETEEYKMVIRKMNDYNV